MAVACQLAIAHTGQESAVSIHEQSKLAPRGGDLEGHAVVGTSAGPEELDRYGHPKNGNPKVTLDKAASGPFSRLQPCLSFIMSGSKSGFCKGLSMFCAADN